MSVLTRLAISVLCGAVLGLIVWTSPATAQDDAPATDAAKTEQPAAEAQAQPAPAEEAAPAKETEATEAHATDTHAADTHGDEGHGHDDGHGHGHQSLAEKHDIGHGNATEMLERPEEFTRFDLSIYTFIVFSLLMLLLWKFAWGPIAKALDARESSIAKMLADAKAASEMAAVQLQQYEAKLLAAQEEAGKIVGDARKSAEEVAAKIQANAEASADRLRERAVADIEQAKNVALHEIAEKSVDTAVDLAGKIIRREVKAADHQQLIAESLNRFQNN